jgi:hypothetical protein
MSAWHAIARHLIDKIITHKRWDDDGWKMGDVAVPGQVNTKDRGVSTLIV